MWEIEYSNEVKFYFLDNGALVFDLLVKIEELRHTPNGIPPEGCTQLEPNFYWWEILRHIVVYERKGQKLIIEIVKPKE
jgi:hypothetical protein